jgi:lysophospholipase L1-like esterase
MKANHGQSGRNTGGGMIEASPGGGRGRRRSTLLVSSFAVLVLGLIGPTISSRAEVGQDGRQHWIGTWATAPQPFPPGGTQVFGNQTLRLIVHTSAGGPKVRIKISNTFGDQPLLIGGAHIARRTAGADIDPPSDRSLTFQGRRSVMVPPRSMAVSDPVDLNVPALSDLAVSLFLPKTTATTTLHLLAQQTSYLSTQTGDSTMAVKFPVEKTIDSWPFLTGVDVLASARGASIVAFGSSTTDGDGSTTDANRRWPDVLAERLQKNAEGEHEFGVLNEGIIGNRLLSDNHSPRQEGGPFGAVLKRYGGALGEAGLARFSRDVLEQAGVRYVIVALGVNDILFPGAFTPATESVSTQSLMAGNREMIARAHKKGVRVIATTIPPFENATFQNPVISFYTPEKERVRQELNTCQVLRDPKRPERLLPEYDSGDHLHANDAGYTASGNAIPLALFHAASKD